MKIKVQDTEGRVLDWLVFKCESAEGSTPDPLAWLNTVHPSGYYSYSTNWAQGGPIIERENIAIEPVRRLASKDIAWSAQEILMDGSRATHSFGPTPLIAAMRCFCASRLGDEVGVPDEIA